MLQYQHTLTADIVRRLMDLIRLVRAVLIVVFLVGVGGMGALIGRAVGLGYVGGGFVGIILGLLLGTFFASLATIGIEWMAQVLVAQGVIISALQGRPGPEA
ncbi:MAG: hypothetical protein ACOX3S_13850 [Anaerolineae bacterium]|jgi:hypothetical protein